MKPIVNSINLAVTQVITLAQSIIFSLAHHVEPNATVSLLFEGHGVTIRFFFAPVATVSVDE
jgi:hypothetical protein